MTAIAEQLIPRWGEMSKVQRLAALSTVIRECTDTIADHYAGRNHVASEDMMAAVARRITAHQVKAELTKDDNAEQKL